MTSFLTIENRKIEIKRYQPSLKGLPTLVFLHEGLGSVSLWKKFPETLCRATGLGGLVYSRLGYGKSDPCDLPQKINFMHRNGIHILPKVIKAAGVKEFILIGHSDGGSISIIFSGHHRCTEQKGLVTIAAHVFCEPLCIASIEEAKNQYENGLLKQKLEKYHSSNTENAFRAWNDVWLAPRFKYFNIEKYLSSITVPFLAIQGTDDQYGTEKQLHSIDRKCSSSAIFLVKGSGHSPHLTHETITVKVISDHILKCIKY